MQKIFIVEHSAWRQMKENYQIYLPYQFHWRPQSAGWVPRILNKKIKKPVFLEYVKKLKTDFDFFPDQHPILIKRNCLNDFWKFFKSRPRKMLSLNLFTTGHSFTIACFHMPEATTTQPPQIPPNHHLWHPKDTTTPFITVANFHTPEATTIQPPQIPPNHYLLHPKDTTTPLILHSMTHDHLNWQFFLNQTIWRHRNIDRQSVQSYMPINLST